MFEDYYFDDPALQGLLDAIGYYPQVIEPMPMASPIMDVQAPLIATPTAAPSLIDIAAAAPAEPTPTPVEPAPAPMTQEDREARRIAANTPPLGTSIVGPTADGDPLAFGTGNTFNVREGQEVRLVDAAGNVIVSGSGVEGANQAVAAAQSLSDELGGNANFKIQTGERTINPDGSVGENRYIDVARAAPSQSGLGFLADYVLPFAASFIPGVGPVLGAALGSGASSALQGRDLEDALKRAALAAGTAYVGGQVFGPATSGAPAPTGGVNADLIPNALEGLNFGSLASAAAPAGVGGAVGDIIVNAATSAAPSLLGSAVGSAVGSAIPSLISAPPSAPVEQPTPEAAQPAPVDDTIVVSAAPPVSGSGLPFASALPVPIEALLSGALTAAQPTPAQPLPEQQPVNDEILVEARKSFLPPETLAAVPLIGGLLAATGGGASNVVEGIDQATGDIVVNAPQAVAAPPPIPGFETAIPAITGGALTAAQTAGTPPSKNKFDFNDVLGTGLSLPQLLSIGGIGADLLKNLLAGGGTGPTTPYVSPFGTGVGFGTGRDMRANPTIMDYERYGFGPEAMFFQPGYGLLSAGAAPQAQPIMAAPQAQPAMVTNPRYEPLI
jgi:hypothetical protein